MRIGLISDIHGNVDALKVVLEEAKKQDVDLFLCSGDFVGYYYEPHIVLELLNDWKVFSVRGNHEDMLFECLENPEKLQAYEKRYGSGITKGLDVLSEIQLDFLKSLPRTLELVLEDKTFLLCHGSPWDTNEYVYPDAQSNLIGKYLECKFDFIIQGHTHYQMLKKVNGLTVINPGSVGQARGKQKGFAQWAVIDTKDFTTNFYNLNYDTVNLIDKINANNLEPEYLKSILIKEVQV